MAIGIDPTVDFAFKRLLGSPEHRRITLHFLNAVLAPPRITEVTILNPFLEKDFEEDKLSVLDVLAIDEYGRRLNVEMQTTVPAGLGQRLAYYAASLYAEQMTEGQDYPALRPAISICLLDAVLFPRLPELHLDFRLRDGVHGETLTEDLQIHTIELPKYKHPVNNEEISEPLEKWAYFLRYAPTSTAADLTSRLVDDEFAEATGVLEMIAKTPAERALYEARVKFHRDENARLLYATQQGREEGRVEGKEIGVQIGTIRVLQRMLAVPESSIEELSQMDLAALTTLASELQTQLETRE